MNSYRLKQVFVALLLAVCCGTVAAVEIVTSVDRNPVQLNESFQITFSAQDSPDDDPDFSPLRKDFDILNQSQSTQSSWVNGKSSKTVQWILQVMAKRTGSFIIPAINFGSDRSQPSSILVTKAGSTDVAPSGKELFLQVEVSNKQPYVQAQVIYTLKFFRRVNISQARLSEPELDNALLQKLGDDVNYNTNVQGVDYVVTERKYAVFPQQSGVMTISPVTLTAAVIVHSQRSRFNGFFNPQTTRTRRIVSQAITLDVKPIPDTYKHAHWLPAEEVHLQQEWSGDITHVPVGEPLTRTLTLLVKASTVGQLPELGMQKQRIFSVNGGQLKIYPDQPVLKEQPKADGMIAFREEKIAFIASKPGVYQLPALEISWWNTSKQQVELANIPAQTLTAVAAAASVPPFAKKAPDKPLPAAGPLLENSTLITQPSANLWQGVSLFLALGWLATLLYIFIKRQAPAPVKQSSERGDIDYSIRALKRACQNNDAKAAKAALLLWGRSQYQVTSLGKIAPFCEARLRDEILKLNQLLYGQQTTEWQGKPLYQAFSEHQARNKIIKSEHDALEPLYRL